MKTISRSLLFPSVVWCARYNSYVNKFVRNMRHISGFLWVRRLLCQLIRPHIYIAKVFRLLYPKKKVYSRNKLTVVNILNTILLKCWVVDMLFNINRFLPYQLANVYPYLPILFWKWVLWSPLIMPPRHSISYLGIFIKHIQSFNSSVLVHIYHDYITYLSSVLMLFD